MSFIQRGMAAALVCGILHGCASTPSPAPVPAPIAAPQPSRGGSVKRGADGKVLEATVIVEVLVGTDGKAKEARIRSSSGDPKMDSSALKEILPSWKLIPATKDGVAVEAWAPFSITFKLNPTDDAPQPGTARP